MSNDLDRVTHHVIQHAASLQRRLPEPGHVRSAVLFGRACEIRTTGEGGASRPDQLLAAGYFRREKLILEISGIQAHTRRQLRDTSCFFDISRERLFARDTAQLSSVAECANNFFDVLDAGLIWSAKPDRVDCRIGDHLCDRAICSCVTYLEPPCICRSSAGVLRVWTPYSAHVGITHAGERLNMKACVEAAADKTDAKALAH